MLYEHKRTCCKSGLRFFLALPGNGVASTGVITLCCGQHVAQELWLIGPDVGGQIVLQRYAARNIDEVTAHHNKNIC